MAELARAVRRHGAAAVHVGIDERRECRRRLEDLIDAHAHPAWYFNRQNRLHTPNDGDTPAQSMLRLGLLPASWLTGRAVHDEMAGTAVVRD